jgi:hypothetical protein
MSSLFKATTTAGALSFVDWYTADNENAAREVWKADCHRNGLPDDSTVAFVECDPKTLKPLPPEGHRALFPGYVTDEEDRQIKSAGLLDNSWGNDAGPVFHPPDNDQPVKFVLGIDHPIDAERELPGGKRIFILDTEEPKTLLETDDLAYAIAEFKKLFGGAQ